MNYFIELNINDFDDRNLFKLMNEVDYEKMNKIVKKIETFFVNYKNQNKDVLFDVNLKVEDEFDNQLLKQKWFIDYNNLQKLINVIKNT